jgi:hypothetical protein
MSVGSIIKALLVLSSYCVGPFHFFLFLRAWQQLLVKGTVGDTHDDCLIHGMALTHFNAMKCS